MRFSGGCSGARGRANVLKGGDIDGGIWSAGQSQGLIHDIPTCEELVKRMGADVVIDARRDDITAAAHSFAPQGIDAVLGLVGRAFRRIELKFHADAPV